MRVVIVGASGYLGSELFAQAKALGYEPIGTTRSGAHTSLLRFELEDKSTWPAVTNQKADVVIWTARSQKLYKAGDPFDVLLNELSDTKFVYVSTDVVYCQRTLQAPTSLGDYARRKLAEQESVLKRTQSAVFVTGPIIGENSAGVIDDRTQKVLDEPEGVKEFWDNVYKTFVPVKGLARTILGNLDKSGQYFVGPPKRQSYFSFYRLQLSSCGFPSERIRPTEIGARELERQGICADTSYVNNPKRLWLAE
jgi:dTDP-4-dehydrorhamnose reductase